MHKLKISWSEYDRRIEKLREHMKINGFDAYLITNGVSIFYFSDFYHIVTERPAALLVEPDGKPVFWDHCLKRITFGYRLP